MDFLDATLGTDDTLYLSVGRIARIIVKQLSYISAILKFTAAFTFGARSVSPNRTVYGRSCLLVMR